VSYLKHTGGVFFFGRLNTMQSIPYCPLCSYFYSWPPSLPKTTADNIKYKTKQNTKHIYNKQQHITNN